MHHAYLQIAWLSGRPAPAMGLVYEILLTPIACADSECILPTFFIFGTWVVNHRCNNSRRPKSALPLAFLNWGLPLGHCHKFPLRLIFEIRNRFQTIAVCCLYWRSLYPSPSPWHKAALGTVTGDLSGATRTGILQANWKRSDPEMGLQVRPLVMMFMMKIVVKGCARISK